MRDTRISKDRNKRGRKEKEIINESTRFLSFFPLVPSRIALHKDFVQEQGLCGYSSTLKMRPPCIL